MRVPFLFGFGARYAPLILNRDFKFWRSFYLTVGAALLLYLFLAVLVRYGADMSPANSALERKFSRFQRTEEALEVCSIFFGLIGAVSGCVYSMVYLWVALHLPARAERWHCACGYYLPPQLDPAAGLPQVVRCPECGEKTLCHVAREPQRWTTEEGFGMSMTVTFILSLVLPITALTAATWLLAPYLDGRGIGLWLCRALNLRPSTMQFWIWSVFPLGCWFIAPWLVTLVPRGMLSVYRRGAMVLRDGYPYEVESALEEELRKNPPHSSS